MSEMLFRSLHIPINIYKTTILYGYKTKDLRKFSYQSALLETKLEIISNNKGGQGGAMETTHEKLVCCKGS